MTFLVIYYKSCFFNAKFKKFKLKEQMEPFANKKISEKFTVEIYELVGEHKEQQWTQQQSMQPTAS